MKSCHLSAICTINPLRVINSSSLDIAACHKSSRFDYIAIQKPKSIDKIRSNNFSLSQKRFSYQNLAIQLLSFRIIRCKRA